MCDLFVVMCSSSRLTNLGLQTSASDKESCEAAVLENPEPPALSSRPKQSQGPVSGLPSTGVDTSDCSCDRRKRWIRESQVGSGLF